VNQKVSEVTPSLGGLSQRKINQFLVRDLGNDMGDKLFRALLNWYMCSDPWPTTAGEHRTITAFLDAEAKRRGYENWVVAYHEFEETKQ